MVMITYAWRAVSIGASDVVHVTFYAAGFFAGSRLGSAAAARPQQIYRLSGGGGASLQTAQI